MGFNEKSFQKLLIQEVLNQCDAAILSWQNVFEANQNRKDDLWTNKVWLGLHGFATACANISKLLAFKDLAKVFDGVDCSPVMGRTWRNSLDHFDERMHEWFNNIGDVTGAVQDRAISGEHDIGMTPPPLQFRRFDPTAKVLVILRRDGTGTDRFELEPISKCVDEIKIKGESVIRS